MLLTFLSYYLFKMTKLIVKDWKQDTVYLIQFPRAGCIPTISPYCLKLETWLRFTGLTFQNVSNEFTIKSERGQLPFIEVNGRQIADTSFIIAELTKLYNLNIDKHLSEKDVGEATLYTVLIEDALSWVMIYFRSLDLSFLGTDQGLIGHFGGVKKVIVKAFVIKKMQNEVSKW